MTRISRTLWDLLAASSKPAKSALRRQAARRRPALPTQKAASTSSRPCTPMQAKYDALVEEMKRVHGVRVRKWRKSSSGVAWTIRYIHTGRIVKLIEAPYPRGPMSCAIFLHEIGHHAIGLGVYKPRCLEEYEVWKWALSTMRARGFNVTASVERRVDRSMRYAVAKATRRGIQHLPDVLHQFL
jgi:hypothetical protein